MRPVDVGAFDHQVHPPGALWIPHIGFHDGGDFAPFLFVDRAFEAVLADLAAQAVGTAAFMGEGGDRDLPAVADVGHAVLGRNLPHR